MMAQRLTEIAARKVEAAVEALQVPQVVRDSITWDIVPAVGPNSFRFMLVLCVPVPGSDDQALLLGPPAFDPFEDQAVVNDLVRTRLHEVQQQADQIRARSNGHGTTPGGLMFPR